MVCCVVSGAAAAERGELNQTYDLPAGEAATTLPQFAGLSGRPVLFLMDKVQGEKTNALSGRFTPREAIGRMLAGTDLIARQDEATGGFTVTRRTAPPAGGKIEVNPTLQPQPKPTSMIPPKSKRLLLALLALLPGILHGQTAQQSGAPASTVQSGAGDASGAAAPDQTTVLPQVTVHAERQDQNLQTVPVAVSVVTADTLQTDGIKNVGDLQHAVPALSAYSAINPYSYTVSIRGQGDTGGNMPGVLMYLNEVPLSSPGLNGYSTDITAAPGLFYDLEDAEVLRGPQGTLFGRNTVGGAVLLQTARPTNDLGGELQLTYGNYDDREMNGFVNVPVIDEKLMVRVAFSGQLRDGYTHVLGEPDHPSGVFADDQDNWSARISVTYRPTAKVQNDTIISESAYDSNGSPFILTYFNPTIPPVNNRYPTLPQLFAEQQALGPRTALAQDVDNLASGTMTTFENITKIELSDDFTVRNILGYEGAGSRFALDGSGTPTTLFDSPSFPENAYTRQYSEEAQLLGKVFNDRLNFVTGAFVIDEPEGAYRLIGQTLLGKVSQNEARYGFQSEALYAQGTYDLSAWAKGLSFIGGFRYTLDAQGFGGRSGYLTGQINPTAEEVRQGAPSWTVGLNEQVNPGTLVYLTSRRGYRSGGENGYDSAGVLLPNYGPEYVTDVEFGIKADWKLGGIPIRTDADIYYQFYTNIQTLSIFIDPVTATSSDTIQNDSDARVWGIEAEMLAQITPDFQIGPSLNFMSFAYNNFFSNVDPSGIPQLEADASYHGPMHKYGLNALYDLPVRRDIGRVRLKADYMWQSMMATDAIDSAEDVYYGGQIPAFGLLNLSADWGNVFQRRVDISVFCDNALNKLYIVGSRSLYGEIGFGEARYGEPRMYGVRFRYRF